MKRATRAVAVTALAIAWATSLPAAETQAVWKEVYSAEPAAFGKEWSNRITYKVEGRKILGSFDNTAVSLVCDGLAPHRWVRVVAEVVVLGSWDGEPGDWGPDTFSLAIDGGPTLLSTSFDHAKHRRQAYPDDHPLYLHQAGATAAEEKNADAAREYFAVYRVEVVAPHTAKSLKLVFAGKDLEGGDETWGLGKVTVSVSDVEALTAKDQIEKLVADLGSAEAAVAAKAIWGLVGAGKPALEALKPLAKPLAAGTKPIDPKDSAALRRARAARVLAILGG